MLDRSVAPAAVDIKKISFEKASSLVISGSEVPFHFLRAGQQPVLKFELTTSLETDTNSNPALPSIVLKMLAKGTKTMNAVALSEALDDYGAFFSTSAGLDRAHISVYCLRKHFPEVMRIVLAMLRESVFPEEELQLLITQTKQELRVNASKNSYEASRQLRHALFPHHPYGKILSLDQLDTITRDQIIDYHEHLFRDINIFLSGDVTDTEINEVSKQFSEFKVCPISLTTEFSDYSEESSSESPLIFEKPASVQSSIRLGKRTMSKKDPEYLEFYLTNQLLGGFFGSRLMKNIREDKGLTYGIYSSLMHARQCSFMVISAEVAKDSRSLALSEVIAELENLGRSQASNEELELVKNHTLGKLLSSLDTPFSLMDKFKNLYFHGLDYTFYDDYVKRLRAISAEDISTMAAHYMNPASFQAVIVG